MDLDPSEVPCEVSRMDQSRQAPSMDQKIMQPV